MCVEISVISGPAKGQSFTFDHPDRFVFGRAVDARISLPNDPYVSRQHFLLEISPPSCKVTDLNSKNGLFVNGIRYGGRKPPAAGVKQASNGAKETQLKDGDEIIVGETCMKVSIPSVAKKPAKLDITHSHPPAPAEHTKAVNHKEAAKPKGTTDHVAVLDQLLKDAVAKKTRPGFPEIGGYHVIEIINRGGMGMVYKAIKVATEQTVAIKVMLPHAAEDPDNVSTFQREIEVTRQLKHPHIVELFDHGKSQETFYFVLEFVDGMDLAKFLESRGGRLSLDESAPIMYGMLDGLAYAHHAEVKVKIADGKTDTYTGVVHRDLKPHNILLAHKGNQWISKITDFGIAKSFESAGLTNITKPGDVLGTPIYWPREQITHYKYLNPVTDVFSLAAVFYEMLTGSWVREGFQELFNKCRQHKRLAAISDYMEVIIGNPAIPIRQRNPDIPKPVAGVIDRALREAEVPYDKIKMRETLARLRYPDARLFRDALVGAFEEAGLSKSQIELGLPEQKLRNGQGQQARSIPQKSKQPAASEVMTQQKDQAKQSESLFQNMKDLEPSAEGSIFYSLMRPASSKEVALLVLDLEQSSAYIRKVGDTNFSNIIETLYRRIKTHHSSSEIVFLKNTGDGFLVVFHTVSAAFSLALAFLETPVAQDLPIRVGLHWGSVKTGPDGDVLGVEVHRVFRIEGVQVQDRVESPGYDITLPASERILITRQGLEQLDKSNREKLRPAGKFRLKGFSEFCELWVLHK